jgi:hypothetical protein
MKDSFQWVNSIGQVVVFYIDPTKFLPSGNHAPIDTEEYFAFVFSQAIATTVRSVSVLEESVCLLVDDFFVCSDSDINPVNKIEITGSEVTVWFTLEDVKSPFWACGSLITPQTQSTSNTPDRSTTLQASPH